MSNKYYCLVTFEKESEVHYFANFGELKAFEYALWKHGKEGITWEGGYC